jgi:hypothetical protein
MFVNVIDFGAARTILSPLISGLTLGSVLASRWQSPDQAIPNRNRPLSFCISLLVMMCLFNSGCGQRNATAVNVPYRLGESQGRLTLSMAEATLVFEGIANPSSRGEGSFNIPLLAGSTGGGSRNEGAFTITTSEATGLCTVSISGRTFKLIERGTQVEFSDRAYPLDVQQTILVAKDGTTTVEDQQQR